jgi:hypothetical protein
MPVSQIQLLKNLKKINLSNSDVTLAIVKEYKKERISHYDMKYVPIDQKLEQRLRNIILFQIDQANSVENYTYDCNEPEVDQVKTIDSEETDFYKIYKQIEKLNPEEDVINNVEELIKAKAYLIILRTIEGIKVVGFKTLPENWKMKKSKGLIPLLYTGNRFEDLEEENVFSISNLIDLFYYNEVLFILSKKDFERGLNFREGMINNANVMYKEVQQLDLFVNLDVLKNKVGNNQRYLRKISTIRNLGHYRDPEFLQKIQQLSKIKKWNILFDDGKIVFTEESIENILTLLQNKRLHSEITNQDFDVESATPV